MIRIITLLFIFFSPPFHISNTSVHASQSAAPQFISDDETETALENWLKELFTVAGVSIPPKVFLLNSMELNAGATFGGIIVVYAGLIMKCKNASQLLGVLAHETGHIAGGHMAKASAAVTESSVPAFASILLGSAATILTGNPGALMAGLAGGAQIFERSLLRHSREQEDSADASALRYLNAKHWPVKGLADFLDMLGNHYTTGHEDPYVQSHPLSPERKAKVRLFQKEQPESYKVPDAYEQQFKRIKAKLFGFLKKRNEVLREYPKSDKSIVARYARLIANYTKKKSPKKAKVAIKKLDELLLEVPGDPYFLELKGQVCFETGQIAKALPYLRESMAKGIKSNNIRLMLAHALIEVPNSSAAELHEAIENLTKITEKHHDTPFAWRLMGSAYGKLNETGNAAACLAEEAWILEKPDLAVMQAKKGKMATNPVLAKRSGDILQQAELANKDKR